MRRIKAAMGALTLAAFMLGVGAGRQARAQSAPDKPIVRIAELEIDPAQIEQYKAYLREEIAASVAQEPGVLSLSAVAIAGKPASIRLLEVYASDAAYQAHLRTPHFLKYKQGTADMVQSLRLIETEPIMLCAKGGGSYC
ncbi:putative quinol monooxygenase [Sphingobium yanoikuyae]|uniref:putative quinol monooxygenase n=1 Tax=Sphingobium yanoikuyae TaxID=13690 RepID=UPI0026F062ED|nr:putative quinol monooxygenase [Sphingobium yanoikuyae]